MIEIHKCHSAHSKITQLHALNNNTAAYSTKAHGIKIFSPQEHKIKLNLSNKHLNSKTTALAFSDNGKLLAFANSTIIYIIYLSSYKIIKAIRTNKEKIEILSFDPSSTYVIAGSASGRVLQYNFNSASLLSRLCSFPYRTQNEQFLKIRENFVSAIAFHKHKIACSGYGGAIFILDLHSRVKKSVILHGKIRIDALCFLNKETIISGNRDGVVEISSLLDKSINRRINTPFVQIKQIVVMPNPDYIIISSDSNNLALINTKSYKIINNRYIECRDKVAKISLLNSESLIVALTDNTLLDVQLPTLSTLKSLIVHNSLDQAFFLIAKEPMLRDSLEHKLLEEKYQSLLSKAISALIDDDKTSALQLTDMFKNIPEKKDEIRALFRGFENYSRLQTLLWEKKYALAYAICGKYPALKHTVEYRNMENIWRKSLKNAQKQMLLGRGDVAKDIFSLYIAIASKRPLINFILNDNKQFLEFLKAIEIKEFKTINTIVKKNKFFAQMPTYITLNNEIQNNIAKTKECLKVGDTEMAKTYLEKLSDASYLGETVTNLHDQYVNTQKLYGAYKNSDFIACYEILDSYECLKNIELGLFLENHWSKRIIQCEKYALEGNIKAVKQVLGELLKLPTRKEKIGDLLRTSFYSKIELLIEKKSFKKAENIIYTYIDIFGLDSEIKAIKHNFETTSNTTLAIVENQHRKKSRDAWFNSDFIMK